MMKKEYLNGSEELENDNIEYFGNNTTYGPLNGVDGTSDFVFGHPINNFGLQQPVYRDQNQVFSPSPPESQGPSPKSSNSSPKSSNSVPFDSSDNGYLSPNGNAKMADTVQPQISDDFDFAMLDEQGGLNGTNGLVSDLFAGMDTDGINELSGNQYFDFDSAASSPGMLLGGNTNNNNTTTIQQNDVPRSLTGSAPPTSQPPPQLVSGTFDPSVLAMPTEDLLGGFVKPEMNSSRASPRMAANSRKRRSEMYEHSPISPTTAMAGLGFESRAHNSPASSHASVSMNGGSRRGSKRTPTPPSSGGEDEGLTMRPSSGAYHSSAKQAWSPNSFAMATSPLAHGVSLGYGAAAAVAGMAAAPRLNTYSLRLRGDVGAEGRLHEKSRVETQIRINLNLKPLPRGVTKIHLPSHTISKPKLICKPAHVKSPDTLELYTSLVCASAVDSNPEFMERALMRARNDPMQEHVFGVHGDPNNEPTLGPVDAKTADGQDNKDLGIATEEDKPLNGGEVRVCSGCIVRERKRAARKKIKKIEDEASWAQQEGRRIIVFNINEILDWSVPDGIKKAMGNGDDSGQLQIDDSNREDGAEVWLPMRIACYCRHQNEKTGFRIIFTLKDYQDHLVAQSITPPILITDDHKTTVPLSGNATSTQTATSSTNQAPTHQGFLIGASPPPMTQQSSVPGVVASTNGHLPYSASDTNLLGLAQPQSMAFRHPSIPMPTSQPQLPVSSRPHSRKPSVSSQAQTSTQQAASSSSAMMNGPSAKKRKGNSAAGKVRNDLAMTRLDDASPPTIHSALPTLTSNAAANPFAANFPPTYDLNGTTFQGSNPTTPLNEGNTLGYHARSQSMEDLQLLHNVMSQPSSARQSRAASPAQQNALALAQAQQTQARQAAQFNPVQFQNQLMGHITANQMQQRLVPFDITRIVPTEGPCRGGIEVTLLGSGFTRSHDVVFGDHIAPKTEFWSETTMVCLLPPSAVAGIVQVVLRNAAQPLIPLPGRGKPFMYNDDTEHKMLALALQVINAKWSGKVEPPKDIAMRLLSSDDKTGGGSMPSGSGGSGNQHRTYAEQYFSNDPVPALESQLLQALDVIDMDDSPYHAKWNLRNKQGQTMLHLACCLGMSRFAAALLARGATPDIVDKGGYTPMHFAALHNHGDLVRRLILNRADPRAQCLSGHTPADLATSGDVIQQLTRGQRSRRGSATSVASAPGKFGGRASRSGSLSTNPWDANDNADNDSDDEEEEGSSDNDELWLRPKQRPPMATLPRSSSKTHLRMIPRVASDQLAPLSSASPPTLPPLDTDSADQAGPAAALAARAAWLNWNFPNINWNLPGIPNPAAGYHLFPNPVARFNAMMNQNGDGSAPPKETDYRWWDLFSSPPPPTSAPTSPAAPPPAYEDIYPGKDTAVDPGSVFDPDAKTEEGNTGESSTAIEAALGRISLAGGTESPRSPQDSSSASTRKSSIAFASASDSETNQKTAAQKAHEAKMQRIENDRKLFFFWLPLLLIILFALSNSWGTQAFFAIKTTYVVVRERMAAAAEEARAARRLAGIHVAA